MQDDVDPDLQSYLARTAFQGLVTLCDSAVPETEIGIGEVGAILRLIQQACHIDDTGAPP